MELSYWLNYKDYTTFQLVIALIGSILWVMAYFVLIRDTIQKKYIEMPFFIACGNFAWEILYAYVFDGYINLGEIYVVGYRAWFFLDIFIFFLLLKYGKKQTDNLWISKHFKVINISLLLFFIAFFYGWIKVGFDNTPINGDGSIKLGATSAYLLNFGISVLYISHFFRKNKVYHFSKSIGWYKGVGTGLFTILFWQVDSQNYLLQILGILIFAGDTFYLVLLYKYQPTQIRKLNILDLQFSGNKKFEDLWKSNPSYISVKGVQLRYYKNKQWVHRSADGKYETTIGIAEGNILIEYAKGEVGVEDTKEGLLFVEHILREAGLENQPYYYIADSTKIEKASFNSRKTVVDFHEKHIQLKQFVLITNGFTRVLIKLMTPINPDVINNWITSDSVENGLCELCKVKGNGVRNMQTPLTLPEIRINEIYEIISKISLGKFEGINIKSIPEDDSFHGIFTALEILQNDKKEILSELNSLLTDSQKALKEQELHYKHLFENSYEIIFVLDSNDVIVNFNKGAEAYCAAQNLELKKGYSIHHYILNELHARLFKELKQALFEGRRREFEIELKYSEIKKLWLHCKCHPVKISENRIYNVFLFDDITDHKKLIHEKRSLDLTIKNQNQKLNEFSQLLSNDLRQQASMMVEAIENLKNSLSYTNINIQRVTLLRKALDDMETVIADLDKVLNEQSSVGKEKKN